MKGPRKRKGYTVKELWEGSRQMAEQLRAGIIPAGTQPEEWMLIGDVAVHTPYIPLYQTCNLVNGQSYPYNPAVKPFEEV